MYLGPAAEQTTDYLGRAQYQNNKLSFIATSEGRAVPTGSGGFEYEYHYKDHLGNLRLAFKSVANATHSATMEPTNSVTEEAKFDNVATTRSSEQARTGNFSAKVNSSQVLGPWKTIKVSKGDRVEATAYAYYFNAKRGRQLRIEKL